MATTRPAAASPMLPLPTPAMSVSATLSRATPRQATTTISHHTRNHTQRTKPPSRFARLRSWISRTKLYLGAAIGLLTLIVTSISLLPSFLGGRYGKKTLELALWTARKDYVEACQEVRRWSDTGQRAMVALPITRVLRFVFSTLIIRVLAASRRWKKDCRHLLALIDSLQDHSKYCRRKYSG